MAIGVSGVCDSSMGDGLYNHAIYVIGHKRLHKLTQSNDIGFVENFMYANAWIRPVGWTYKLNEYYLDEQ